MRTLFALAVLVLGGCGGASERDTSSRTAAPIIPAPAAVTARSGEFSVTPATRVTFSISAEAEEVARYFRDLVAETMALALPLEPANDESDAGGIHFVLTASEGSQGEEGYSLRISPQRIAVSAESPRGLFYGAVTLWQVLTSNAARGTSFAVPAMAIDDAPRFRWRGLMLDSARHYQSPEFIMRFIDWMALHKLNVLHWHLTDDQAWRLEIKKYPRLTSVAAWRVPAGAAAAADIDPATGEPRRYGGFYSQEDVRRIVAHAARRHVTIVPEIGMPGHATAAIVAYPKLGVLEQPPVAVPSDWGIYPNLFNVEESTFEFLESVLTEVMALFPSEYIHIGGDEAVKGQWRASARVQARMRELGIPDEDRLQSYFVQRMEKFLNRHGRRLIGWDEILEGGLAPNATVMSWRGIDGAVVAASAGHDAVLSPHPVLYFDHRQSASPNQPPGRGMVIRLEDVYRFDPAPPSLAPQQQAHILGVQANIWTEHIRTEERLEHMTFPRAAALAEVGWSPAHRIDWQDFLERLPAHLQRYRLLGIRHAGIAADEPLPADSRERSSRELTLCSEKLVLALEDDAPLQGERAVFLVDIMDPCWIFPAVELARLDAIAVDVGQVPFNFQIGDAVKSIPLPQPRTRAGELEVRLDHCEGELLATIPLEPALAAHAVTPLPPATIEHRAGRHDLCFRFTRAQVDPIWTIDRVRLLPQ